MFLSEDDLGRDVKRSNEQERNAYFVRMKVSGNYEKEGKGLRDFWGREGLTYTFRSWAGGFYAAIVEYCAWLPPLKLEEINRDPFLQR